MDKNKLRGADFFSGIFFIVFSGFGLRGSFKMPMTDTYGGVSNVWYVSPALFPLIVNFGLLLLGISLLVFSIKKGGYAFVKSLVRDRKGKFFQITNLDSHNQKFWIIVLLLTSQVYIYLPNIDFYLAMAVFLMVFIAVFYIEMPKLTKPLVLTYLVLSLLLGFSKVTGLMAYINGIFLYSMDVVVLAYLVFLVIIINKKTKFDDTAMKDKKKVISIAFISPMVVLIVFKYLLLIPMPKEGGIISLINLIYYSLR